MFNYLCTLNRMSPTGNTLDDGHQELEDSPVYQGMICSRPSQRVTREDGELVQVSDTQFTMRVPIAADVQIGDSVTNVRKLDGEVFFQKASIINVTPLRRFTGIIMERR